MHLTATTHGFVSKLENSAIPFKLARKRHNFFSDNRELHMQHWGRARLLLPSIPSGPESETFSKRKSILEEEARSRATDASGAIFLAIWPLAVLLPNCQFGAGDHDLLNSADRLNRNNLHTCLGDIFSLSFVFPHATFTYRWKDKKMA